MVELLGGRDYQPLKTFHNLDQLDAKYGLSLSRTLWA